MKASGVKRPPSQKVDDFRVPDDTRPTYGEEKKRVKNKGAPLFFKSLMPTSRVNQLLADMGWVDLDLKSPPAYGLQL